MAKKKSNENLSSLLQTMGISQSIYASLSPKQQSALTLLGAGYTSQVKNNAPIPDTLSKKEMNKLWDLAKNDPTINQFYANDLKQAEETINMSMATDTANFNLSTKEQQEKFIQDKLNLDASAAKYGQVYSGIRGQAKQQLNESNLDTISSTTNQMKEELDSLGSQFETKYGTPALQGTALAKPIVSGNIGGLGGTAYTGPGTGSVGYTPMGGVIGTEASAKLADQIAEQNELVQEKLQGKSLKNIKSSMLPPSGD
jgi:hypothetical protein